MIYIVSGYMRCGTSMMMEALIAGGMEAAYSEERTQKLNKRWGDDTYQPNDNYYELTLGAYGSPDFPAAYDGKLIKCLAHGLTKIPKCEARVVFMRRPRDEVYRSCVAAFGAVPGPVSSDFDREMDCLVEAISDRRSVVSLDQVQYGDVLDDAPAVFETLKDAGWPINPKLSATVPSKDKRRQSVLA